MANCKAPELDGIPNVAVKTAITVFPVFRELLTIEYTVANAHLNESHLFPEPAQIF